MIIVEAIRDNWVVLLIPVFAGLVGWITNVAAVWLLFHPVDFRGIPPYLGWQGVIPGASRRMGAYLAWLISNKLLDLREMFAGLDAAKMLPAMRPALHALADEVLDETVRERGEKLWAAMNDEVRAQVREAVRKEVELLATNALGDLKESGADLIDLGAAIESAVARDKEVLSNLFLAAGGAEFEFIKISGLYFGFLFGIPQFLIWVVYPEWWILPAGGLLVGYVTNWLAMRMIFEPKEPRKFGPITFQGLFHKRQHEVATDFSHTVSKTMLTPQHVVGQFAEGPGRERVLGIFEKHVGDTIAKYEKHPMASVALQQVSKDDVQRLVYTRMDAELTREGGIVWHFVERTLDVAGSMSEKLRNLDSESFEGVLRPAFQQDEWKLIVVGAVLGGIAGWLQAVYLFSESMPG